MTYRIEHSRNGNRRVWHINDPAIASELGNLPTAHGTHFTPTRLTVSSHPILGDTNWYISATGPAVDGPRVGARTGFGTPSVTSRLGRRVPNAPDTVLDFIARHIPDAAIPTPIWEHA